MHTSARTSLNAGAGWRLAGVLLLLLVHPAGAASPAAHPEPAGSASFAETAFHEGEPRVRAHLTLDVESGSHEARIGVLLEMANGWHVYARDPGETGLPTRLSWSAAGGVVEELPWPAPQHFRDTELDLASNGYSGQVVLPARVRFEARGERRVRVSGEILACADACIPGSFVLERDLAGGSAPADAIAAPLFLRLGSDAAGGATGLVRVLFLAFLGGLLLNGMPCVLPVLAIKALALAEGTGRRRDALEHGAAYAGGVLASMAALAGAVLLLRSGGEAVGWGFQFQEPGYIAALAVVVVLFAANLLGAFDIHAGAGRLAELGAHAVGPRRSFFDGLLTVALATPCSAPFLGTAAGFAMAGAAPVTLAIFLAIGVGLAAPLTAVAVLPGARRWIPKPGPWMNELRAGLGFVLLATAVWLVWILGRAQGPDAAGLLLAGLLVTGVLAWAFGRLQAHQRAPAPLTAVLTGVVLLALGAGLVGTGPSTPLRSDPWRPDRVAEHLSAGRPTFVYFTADWCLTCKVNERMVLADPRVQEAIDRLGFAVLRGDWTRRDEALGAEIARLGRSGVPLYAVYGVATPDAPELLPELLTVDRLLAALQSAAGSAPGRAGSEYATRATSPRAVWTMGDESARGALEGPP
jgi:cytochrome c biogenesis protein CcdA